MNEESLSKDKNWMRCQSKTHKGRFYMFNTDTGETRWCSNSTSKDETQTNISIKQISKTPAQDRLKRLQRNLEKTKPKDPALVKFKDPRQSKKLNSSTAVENLKTIKESFTIDKQSSTHKEFSSSSTSKIPETKLSVTKEATDKKGHQKVNKCSASPKEQNETVQKYRIPKKTDKESSITSENKNHQIPNKEDATPLSTVPKKRHHQPSLDIKKEITDVCSPKKMRPSKETATSSITMPPPTSKEEKMIECDLVDDLKSCKAEKSGIISVIKDYCTNLYKKVVHNHKEAHSDDLAKQSNLSRISKPFKSKKSEDNNYLLKSALQENQNRNSETRLPISTVPNSSSIGSANDRLQRLRKSLQLQQASLKPTQPKSSTASSSLVSSTSSIVCSSDANSSFQECEPMDWQPILEDLSESVTSSFVSNVSTSCEHFEIVNENLLRLAAEKMRKKRWKTDFFYFVVDTNVFLENLTFVDELTTMKLCDTAGTLIYVPYCVLQELDKLKIRSPSESIKTRSARAIKYLNNAFENKVPNIEAQSATEENKRLIKITSPDDSILNCCLQVKEHIENFFLLTEDINLRNKAMCSEIMVSTKSDLISKHESLV